MKMIQTLPLILIFCINLYAKENPENLLQTLPLNISYFTAGKMNVYDKVELGASIRYKRSSLLGNTWATVYVYDLGEDKINNTIINKAYEMGKNDIYELNKHIKLIDKGKKTIPIQNKNHEIYYSMFQLRMNDNDSENKNSFIFVSGNQDYLYKIRISSNEKNMREDMIEFSYKVISILLSFKNENRIDT